MSLLTFSCKVTSSNQIQDPGFGECPQANGCECESSNTCPENSECTQLYRGKYCVPKPGSIVPEFKGIDQYGAEFSLYDIAQKGKPILIELCSSLGNACQDFSAWKSHQNNSAETKKWWKEKFTRIRKLLDNNDIYWATIIHTDENKNPATSHTVRKWHNRYPHQNIIVLADPQSTMKKWIRPTGFPCLILVDEDMVLQAHALRGIETAIDELYLMLDR